MAPYVESSDQETLHTLQISQKRSTKRETPSSEDHETGTAPDSVGLAQTFTRRGARVGDDRSRWAAQCSGSELSKLKWSASEQSNVEAWVEEALTAGEAEYSLLVKSNIMMILAMIVITI